VQDVSAKGGYGSLPSPIIYAIAFYARELVRISYGNSVLVSVTSRYCFKGFTI